MVPSAFVSLYFLVFIPLLLSTWLNVTVIVFVVDAREDLTSNDLAIRDMLMKTNKKVIVALNKLDNKDLQEERIYYYYELGFEYVIPISAAHKIGFGNLLNDSLFSLVKKFSIIFIMTKLQKIVIDIIKIISIIYNIIEETWNGK